MVRVIPTSIPEVRIIELTPHGDARGLFVETFNQAIYGAHGINFAPRQTSVSRSGPAGTVRGLHIQRPPHAQAKLIRCLRGRLFDVALDMRRGSPSFGRHVAVTLEEGDWRQFYMPVGFAHGFCTTAPDTEVEYILSETYAPAHESGVRWDDPALGIDWPVDPASAMVSEKDAGLPSLGDLPPVFE